MGNNSITNSLTPVMVQGLPDHATYVSAAENYSCAILVNGSAWYWGRDESSVLGDGTTLEEHLPIQIICGEVKCWGLSIFGNVGDATTVNRQVPTPVYGFTTLGCP